MVFYKNFLDEWKVEQHPKNINKFKILRNFRDYFFIIRNPLLDRIGKYDKALDLLNTVIKTNNQNIELLILKAKILKHKEKFPFL